MNNLPVPEPMNVTSGNVAESCSFREQWNDYEIATGLREKDEKIRVATLRGIMGKDCYNIKTGRRKERVTSILDGLEKYFKPALNVTYERFVSNTCDQQSHEIIDEYVNKLRGLSETCEFETLRDSLIKDRVVLGTKNKQVRVTLLNQKELTLDKALSVCRNSKLTEQYLLKINDNSTSNVNFLQNVLRKEGEWKREQRNCEYCGFKHAKRKCPAYGKICQKCNKKNHFANVCKTKANLSVKSLDAVCNDTEYSEIGKLFSLTHEIGAVSSKGNRWFVTLEMKMPNCESQLVKCHLDAGSTCNTISYTNFCKICFDENKLESSNVKLKLYDGTILTPRGQSEIPCWYKDKLLNLLFQVVEDPLVPLLSAEACEQLGLLQIDFAMCDDNIISRFPGVFEGLCCLPGSYEIAIDHLISPVKHAPRRIPISIKTRVKEELDRLANLQVTDYYSQRTD